MSRYGKYYTVADGTSSFGHSAPSIRFSMCDTISSCLSCSLTSTLIISMRSRIYIQSASLACAQPETTHSQTLLRDRQTSENCHHRYTSRAECSALNSPERDRPIAVVPTAVVSSSCRSGISTSATAFRAASIGSLNSSASTLSSTSEEIALPGETHHR